MIVKFELSNMKKFLKLKINRMVALLAVLLTVAVQTQAQVEISGQVIDETGEGIIGGSIMVKGQPGKGTVTDFDGNFKLSVPSEQSSIVVSYVGMTPQELKVGEQRTFKIVLKEDKQIINEVVVVGYGQQKKASVVGAIAHNYHFIDNLLVLF